MARAEHATIPQARDRAGAVWASVWARGLSWTRHANTMWRNGLVTTWRKPFYWLVWLALPSDPQASQKAEPGGSPLLAPPQHKGRMTIVVETINRVDDDYCFQVQDAIAGIIREGKRRARKHGQNLMAEKINGVEKAALALFEALVKGEATDEAAEQQTVEKGAGERAKNGRKNGANNEEAQHY
jgi:hypothetical protein